MDTMHFETGIVEGAKIALSHAAAANSLRDLTGGRLFARRLHRPAGAACRNSGRGPIAGRAFAGRRPP